MTRRPQRRLLIITYYWPPLGGSGVQRWLKFAKYLPQFGWQPVIYTPENPDFPLRDASLLKDVPETAEVLRRKIFEPYSLYARLQGKRDKQSNFGQTFGDRKSWKQQLAVWVRGNVLIPDPRRFWVRPSVQFLKNYLQDHPVDAVVTTGPPHSMHLIGLGLKKHFPTLPWIADFRDPWASFDILSSFQPSARARQRHQKLEKAVLEGADRVIMVSPSMHEKYQDFDLAKHHLITNGFDESDFPACVSNPLPNADHAFRIYHTGLLNGIRNPAAFWDAAVKLCRENPDFDRQLRIELVGSVDEAIASQLQHHPVLSNKVHLREWMAHQDLLREYPQADLFLLLVNNSDNAKSQIPGKLFEYLANRKPILLFGPANADAAGIIEELGIGRTCGYEDSDRAYELLARFFAEYQSGKPLSLSAEALAPYTRYRLTERLVDVLLELLVTTTPDN